MNQTLPLLQTNTAPPAMAAVNDLVADVLHACRDALYGTRCRVAIAGGAARDIAFDTMPRDLDLIVCPRHEDDVFIVLQALELGLGYKIARDFDHDGFDLVNLGDYEFMEMDNRWSRVVKLSAPGKLDVDVLVSTLTSLEDTIALFDFNVNQFAILQPYTQPRFFGDSQGKLVQNREASVTPERVTHIQTIAAKFGWSI